MTTTMKSYLGLFNQRHINYVSMMTALRQYAELDLDERDIEFSTENWMSNGKLTGQCAIYCTETISDAHKQALRIWIDGFKACAQYRDIERGIRYPIKRS